MAGRAGQLPLATQLRIGRAVLAARAEGVCWKQLAGRFGRDRSQLHRYAAKARKSARCTILPLATRTPRMNGWAGPRPEAPQHARQA